MRASAPASAILQPLRNCWRTARAHRFYCIQDAADHFRLVRQALLAAKHTILILGWDTTATTDLLPGEKPTDGPKHLAKLLAHVARRRRDLQCYILTWDYATVFALERDLFARLRFRWRMPRRVHFAFDNHHPTGGSHHQKIVVVDDALAFCGGIDLTGHRWDTPEHRVRDPRRTSRDKPYQPYHEVQAMVDGPVAAALGELARERWKAFGDPGLPAVRPSSEDLWPSTVRPDLTDIEVAISRTLGEDGDTPAVRECEALFLDSIAAAQKLIYIESQYFTNETVGKALAQRLQEPEGPEIILVSPEECSGWLEKQTIGAFRVRAFQALLAADRHKRLRLVYPVASRSAECATFIHSKVMIVDDRFVRIGSANLSNRSMFLDSECDLAIDAGDDDRARKGIRGIRDRLIGEHLGIPAAEVERRISEAGSLRSLIDKCRDADRTLALIEISPEEESAATDLLRTVVDPAEPAPAEPTGRRPRHRASFG